MSAKKATTKAVQANVDEEKAEVEAALQAKAEAEKAEQAKLDAEKAEAEKAEQAKLDAEKAEAEKAEQAKLDAEKAEAEKAEQAKLDAEKAEAEKAEQAKLDAEKAEPVVLKPWNGEPLMAAPESETVETAKAAPIKPAKTSGKTYHAQWTLHHNNKRYVAGDTLTLSDDKAKALVDAGVLVAVK